MLLIHFSLQRNRKISKTDKDVRGPAVSSLDSDGPTQEFSLGTPRIRTTFEEPSTPEMPDLSSVTQDICKVSGPFVTAYTLHACPVTLSIAINILKSAPIIF